MCCHLSLLLPHPLQQQPTNHSVRGTVLSQSGAAACQLSQPIRGSHTLPGAIKALQRWGCPSIRGRARVEELWSFGRWLLWKRLPLAGSQRDVGGAWCFFGAQCHRGHLSESKILQGFLTWIMSWGRDHEQQVLLAGEGLQESCQLKAPVKILEMVSLRSWPCPTCLRCAGDDPSPAWRPEPGSVGADATGWKVKSTQPLCAFKHGVVLGPSPRAVSQVTRSAVTCGAELPVPPLACRPCLS